jgi:hypothetical protein
MHAEVHVRLCAAPGAPRETLPEQESPPRLDLLREMLPPPHGAIERGEPLGAYLLHRNLVLALLGITYRAYADRFKSGKGIAARLQREGRAWIVRPGVTARELHVLHRRAKHYMRAIWIYGHEIEAGLIPDPSPSADPSPPSPDPEDREPSPQRSSGRPRLRLVRVA